MNTEQVSMNAEHQAVPQPLAVDYDAEAASQPALPPRSNDNDKTVYGAGPSKSNSRCTLVSLIFVLLAMVATGVVVWFVMDSKIQNQESRMQSDVQFQPSDDSSPSTLPPNPSPSTAPALEISDMKPLSMCMGDCDDDTDCGPGLMCFQRNQNTPVPGCSGGLEDNSNSDYCIPIKLPSLAIITDTNKLPLGLCEGDCDTNDDCADGLSCHQRSEFEFVPGCSGGSDDGSRTDYCAPSSLVPETYLMSLEDSTLFGNPDDNFGSSVSLSQTVVPRLMAVGAVDRGSTGYVNIYMQDGADDSWVFGATIEGDEIGSDFGHSVSMSWDGKYVAVGMPESKNGGRVKIFELSMTTTTTTNSNEIGWNQVGNDIAVGPPQEYGGYAVSLSEDGSILAVTERYSFHTFKRTNSGEWVVLGSRVDIGSFGGGSISLSGDGSRVAVNSQPYDVYPPDGFGNVYEFNGTEWTQVGQNLGDLSIFDSFGLDNIELTSTSLSGNGATVVVSCIDRTLENSYVRVYQDIGDSQWIPVGEPILGKLDEFAPASTVEISKDGAVVAVGDYELGRVRLYEFDTRPSQWILVGEVHAVNEDDQLGVALSLTGGRGDAYLAIGSPNKKHIVGNPGFVTTYKTTFGIRPDPTPAPSSAPTEWVEKADDPDAPIFAYSPEYVWSGENNRDSHAIAGLSVAMSSDGNVFAYGLSSDTVLNRVIVDGDDRVLRPELSGQQIGDEFGHSIALSNDGLIMAVGLPNSLVGTVEGSGRVQVYLYDPTGKAWSQMGDDIVPTVLQEYGRFGHSVSLSDNGDVLAIGAPMGNGVSIFRFDNNEWVKMGDDITVPETKAAWHGWSVSLSSDGLVVAVGGPTNEDNWDEAGACRIYEFVNNSNWQLRGQPILGEQRHGLLGTSVSLSGDGNIVAIGAINYELPEATANREEDVFHYGLKAGAAFVFEYSPDGNWNPRGKPIFGDAAFDRFGKSVSLTKDGKNLAVGAPEHGEGGQVRVFVFDEEHLYWDQVGDVQRYDSYDDEGKDGSYGTAVALTESVDGLRLLVGAPKTKARYGDRLGLLPKDVGEVCLYLTYD
ncbi:unnamed protein product [Cylindrotheca closterium]|uniref:Uncharacterized protein n=1 Tax=Cylindrotheca closterium TaxID=2856 RepID=A0AAD2CVD5_9STRA|nr:unnamed protein product [Cylindrotheca closterium]